MATVNITAAEKTCPDCREAKPMSQWNRNRKRRDGLSIYCRACHNRQSREAYARREIVTVPAQDRVCPGCNQGLPAIAFNLARKRIDGLTVYCRGCSSTRASHYYDERGEELRAKRRLDYQASPQVRGRAAARSNARYRAMPHVWRERSWRSWGIKGMTWARYEQMIEAQNGLCAICGATEAENGRALAVDHDHSTGEPRGLLCFNCNIALGKFQDNPKILRRALDYLGA